MKIEDMDLWSFIPPLVEGSEIECPECGKRSRFEKWSEGEIGCDLCGSHPALRCPNCDELFDHVYSPIFKTFTSL